MKIYYATVNTGSPATGFISTGEVLTEEQAAALGVEKLAELVSAGVLAIGGETAEEPADTGSEDTGTDGGEDTGTDGGEDTGTDGGEDTGTDAGKIAEEPTPTEDGEDDLPELNLAEELVGEAEPENATKRGRGKGGKSK